MAKKDKMVIVMRTDLNMGAGKMISQAGHAIVDLLAKSPMSNTLLGNWLDTGMKKVALAVSTEEELLQIVGKAREHLVPYALITDAGLTQVDPGTKTCAAIGPASEQTMKKITGALRLLP